MYMYVHQRVSSLYVEMTSLCRNATDTSRVHACTYMDAYSYTDDWVYNKHHYWSCHFISVGTVLRLVIALASHAIAVVLPAQNGSCLLQLSVL